MSARASSKIIASCIKSTLCALGGGSDKIKEVGSLFDPRAITISVTDMIILLEKRQLIEAAEEKIIKIEQQFRRGFISADERKADA